MPITQNNLLAAKLGTIIIPHGETEAAYVEYVGIQKDEQGYESLEVIGRSLSGWLDRRVIDGVFQYTGGAAFTILRLLMENATSLADTNRKLPSLTYDGTQPPTGQIEYCSPPFANLLDEITAIAQHSKIGYRIITNIKYKQHTFSLYNGIYHRAGDPIPCIFSRDFDNLLSSDYTASDMNYKTCAWIIGKEDGETGETPTAFIAGDDGSGQGLNSGMSFEKTTELFDLYIDEGHSIEELMLEINAMFEASGFFRKDDRRPRGQE